MTKEEVEILIEKSRLSEEDKSAIIAEADARGLSYTIRKNCRRCYDNILLHIYEDMTAGTASVSADGYRLKNVRDDFTICGVRYNNALLPSLSVAELNEIVLDQLFVYDGVRSE